MRLPTFIYEALPKTYFIIGVLDIIYFAEPYSGLGLFSGVLFLITSYLVRKLRRNYRLYHVDWSL